MVKINGIDVSDNVYGVYLKNDKLRIVLRNWQDYGMIAYLMIYTVEYDNETFESPIGLSQFDDGDYAVFTKSLKG